MLSLEQLSKKFKDKAETCSHKIWFHGDVFLETRANYGLCSKCTSHITKNENGEWISYRTAIGEKISI